MELADARIVTADVAALAGFYSFLLGVDVVPNDYYVEVPAGPATVAFSRRRFTEPDVLGSPSPCTRRDKIILDFLVNDVDHHCRRVDRLGVSWIMPPTTQPWGNRSMMFRDPDGNIVNVFAPPRDDR